MPSKHYYITSEQPKLDPDTAKPILLDNQPIYELNYFCDFEKHPDPRYANIYLITWDTDISYAMPFEKTEIAQEFIDKFISVDGCKIVSVRNKSFSIGK